MFQMLRLSFDFDPVFTCSQLFHPTAIETKKSRATFSRSKFLNSAIGKMIEV